MYISAWRIYTSNIHTILEEAVAKNEVRPTDTVWYGPSGDAVVAECPYDLGEEYGDYVDKGEVEEYLD